MMSIKNILREEDIEGFIQLGAPSDEYDSEAREIEAAMSSLGDESSEEQIVKVIEEVWKGSFGPLSSQGIEARRTAFQRAARRIVLETMQSEEKRG